MPVQTTPPLPPPTVQIRMTADNYSNALELVPVADIHCLTNHVGSIFNALKAAPVGLDVPLHARQDEDGGQPCPFQ
jgi:hypothetical protein